MTPLEDLQKKIYTSHRLICDYEAKRQVEDDGKKKLSYQREIDEQWQLIEGWLSSYFVICREARIPAPEDIRQIAYHFPRFLAENLEQALGQLRTLEPQTNDAVNIVVQVIQELDEFHQKLNEWKEVHNLVQDCLTTLMPLKDEISRVIDGNGEWRKATGRSQWRACYLQFRRLEAFAEDIQHIDIPFCRQEGFLQGPTWMMKIASFRSEFEACLQESDLELMDEALDSLWHACYDSLFYADKRLRSLVGELHKFSNEALRSINHGK
jgi:hypothetical protein